MYITFYGAAREVTGSCSLVEAGDLKILVDCGMYQGSDFNEGRNLEPLPFDPKELNAVLVTHAHLDHIGRLPLLIKGGYAGHFYATGPTMELAQLILEDAYHVMLYDNKKFGRPILYDEPDIAAVMAQFKAVEYGEELKLSRSAPLIMAQIATSQAVTTAAALHKSEENVSISPPPKEEEIRGEVSIRFHDVGHILGSAFIEIVADGKRVVFSGDIGNHDAPIIRETALLPPDADALVCESTYGDRIHESSAERQAILEREVLTAVKRGGVLMIPSFALERTQELIYELNELIDRKYKLPRVPIFLDSPLAIGALQVYRKYHQYYDEEAMRLFKGGDDLFQFPGLEFTETTEASKRINQVPPPKIIIAGAGMMNGGRILHHALRYLSDPNSTLLIIGYQAKGTLGREILDGKATVNVMGERVHVRCSVRAIGALSAHADQEKLLDWIGGGASTPKKVYLNHGEPSASEALAKRLTNDLGIKATVVDFGLKVEV